MTTEDPAGRDAAAARAGDRAAFKRLYERYARMVHGVPLARLRPQGADDVVQEVRMRALEGLKTPYGLKPDQMFDA